MAAVGVVTGNRSKTFCKQLPAAAAAAAAGELQPGEECNCIYAGSN